MPHIYIRSELIRIFDDPATRGRNCMSSKWKHSAVTFVRGNGFCAMEETKRNTLGYISSWAACGFQWQMGFCNLYSGYLITLVAEFSLFWASRQGCVGTNGALCVCTSHTPHQVSAKNKCSCAGTQYKGLLENAMLKDSPIQGNSDREESDYDEIEGRLWGYVWWRETVFTISKIKSQSFLPRMCLSRQWGHGIFVVF